ncbi:MAG: hypothetical protein RL235_293 [Chlamydiota bacterium]|jgi:hypothetical protein
MAEIRGSDSLSPREIKTYERQYKEAAELFENSVDRCMKSDNPYQRAKFREVMDRAMHIMNEAARALKQKNSSLTKQNEKIKEDFAAFNEDKSPQAGKKLIDDLEKAKHSVA